MRFRRPSTFDAVLAAVLVAVALVETLTSTDIDATARTIAAAVLVPLPLAWRRIAPLAVLVAVLVMWPLSGASDSLYTFVCGLVAAYSGGAHPDTRRAYIGAGAIVVFVALALAVSDRSGAADFLFITILFGGAWTLGRVVFERTSHGAAAERRAEQAERDREAALADERRRIARELHDVVAHTVSLMVVQTGVVRRRLRTDRPNESELLAEVEDTGRDAIAELRRLLGVLRTDDDDAMALAPQPGIGQLDPLLAQVRSAGLPVDLQVEGDAVALAPGVDLAAYRVVQESLTNTLKHAKAGRAHVVLRYRGDELGIEVTDDGLGVAGHGNGTGHGLIGMRERVALYGGTIATGPEPERGYAVRASLPLREAGT